MTEVQATPPSNRPAPPPNRPKVDRRAGDNPVFEWFFAIIDGISDTAHEMLNRGRQSAHDAYDEGWERFDEKTKRRRKKR